MHELFSTRDLPARIQALGVSIINISKRYPDFRSTATDVPLHSLMVDVPTGGYSYIEAQIISDTVDKTGQPDVTTANHFSIVEYDQHKEPVSSIGLDRDGPAGKDATWRAIYYNGGEATSGYPNDHGHLVFEDGSLVRQPRWVFAACVTLGGRLIDAPPGGTPPPLPYATD